MAREQKGGGEAEEKGGRRREAGITTKPATTMGMVEEANASAGDNRACSNGGNREDECGGSKRVGAKCWGSS